MTDTTDLSTPTQDLDDAEATGTTKTIEATGTTETTGTSEAAEIPEVSASFDLEVADETSPEPEEGFEPAGAPRSNRVRLLEKEGEVAADFLERLLDIADLDGDIEVDIDGDRAAVSIVDSEDGRVPRRLVGSDAKVLDALQELTRLAAQNGTGERSRLMLDIAGYRAERRRALVELARVAIDEVKTTGAQRALENMTAFERKVIHDEVAAAGLDSESEGVEPHRHIVILPA